MALAIQEYIWERGFSAVDIKDNLGINSKTDFSGDGRRLFKYDKYDNKGYMYEETRECRGLILDELNNYSVVAYPFYKFFNHFEHNAPSINWDNARAYQKFDGTCIVVYSHLGKWMLSTLGSLNAEGPVNAEIQLTFFGLAYPQINPLLNKLDKGFTYVFELCSKFNRVVTKYDKAFVRLIMVRHNETLEEISIETFANLFDIPTSIKVSSLEETIDLANKLQHLEEGYVVNDGVNRIKVKSETYFSAFKTKYNVGSSFTNMAKYILSGNYEEFLHMFPEYKEPFEWCSVGLNMLINDVTRIVNNFGYDRKNLSEVTRFDLPVRRGLYFMLLDHPDLDLRQHLLQRIRAYPQTGKHLFEAIKDLMGEPKWILT